MTVPEPRLSAARVIPVVVVNVLVDEIALRLKQVGSSNFAAAGQVQFRWQPDSGAAFAVAFANRDQFRFLQLASRFFASAFTRFVSTLASGDGRVMMS